MTLIIPSDKFDEFKTYLTAHGYTFEDRQYQLFLAKKPGTVINLYTNGKIVFGGTDLTERGRVEEYLKSLNASQVVKTIKEYANIEVSGSRIGTDEVGKGDYFGPLVVGGVAANETQVKELQELGAKASKALSDTTIKNLAVQIRKILKPNQSDVIVIGPLKYNMLHKELRNVNGILGWGHARAIENLVVANPTCDTAVADQFGDQSYIEKALMQKGRTLKLIQSPKAEREVTVAAASILGRSEFIDRMREMSHTYGIDFPKGSTNVIPTAELFVKQYGSRALLNVAKVHFRTTLEIPGVVEAELEVRIRTMQEELPTMEARISRDIRLECFNLIDSLEPELRRFIECRLRTLHGNGWWVNGVDKDVRGKAESLKQKEINRGVQVELIDCLDMDHYRIIVTTPANWKGAFEPVFKDKEALLARLKILKEVRNPTAHSRALRHNDKLGVVSAVQWLKGKIGTGQDSL